MISFLNKRVNILLCYVKEMLKMCFFRWLILSLYQKIFAKCWIFLGLLFQTKIEQFIHSGLRNPMLVGHRQAWAWMDKWCGLTIADIRELERQTQLELAKRMAQLSGEVENHMKEENTQDDVDGEVCMD